jgi:hypothetical protein
MSNETVQVVSISHSYGTDISVHRTIEGAKQHVYDYVVRWWGDAEEEEDEPPAGMSREFAIKHYFNKMSGREHYDITSAEVWL